MIRINLLAVEREKVKRRATFQLAEKVTVACSLILVATAVFVGWWFWTLSRQAADLDRDIETAQTETARLRVIIQRVQQAEQHRAQLEQRVNLIEQLRRAQSAPVHLLDEISRNLPDALWLTNLQQKGNDITLEGRCMQLKAVSDLVANFQSSAYFKRPVDTVTTDTERNEAAQTELVKFTLKVQYAPPGMAAVAEAAAKPGGAAK